MTQQNCQKHGDDFKPKLIDFDSYVIKTTLDTLLQDKSTKKNIIWATNTYKALGPDFDSKSHIESRLFKWGFELEPRIHKSEETQLERTRKKAEVFTPSWIVNKMNNYCDEEWFGRKDVFNTERDKSWDTIMQKIVFPQDKSWQDYILSTRLEITCGEAPFLVSRYDASTGKMIEPTIIRMGLLDRKLRIVTENCPSKDLWIQWALKALQSCYGYEYQGDSLLVARINILLSFVEYYEESWHSPPDKALLLKASNIIAWNIWQMDGLSDTVPYGAPYEKIYQLSMLDILYGCEQKEPESVPCRIYDWRANRSLRFMDLKEI